MLVPLVVTLIFGFATNLHVVYGAVSDYYSTIFGALRMAAVYLLGGHHLLLVSRLLGVYAYAALRCLAPFQYLAATTGGVSPVLV